MSTSAAMPWWSEAGIGSTFLRIVYVSLTIMGLKRAHSFGQEGLPMLLVTITFLGCVAVALGLWTIAEDA